MGGERDGVRRGVITWALGKQVLRVQSSGRVAESGQDALQEMTVQLPLHGHPTALGIPQ